MSDLGRRLAALETIYQRAGAPRLLICERDALGRLVTFGTDEEVEPCEGDTVIVFALQGDGPQ